jgi:hypothetical protein
MDCHPDPTATPAFFFREDHQTIEEKGQQHPSRPKMNVSQKPFRPCVILYRGPWKYLREPAGCC